MAVTIYELAKAAGCSISTVSKALNDSYSISEATKTRIRTLAQEMCYTPNARARSFARKKSGTVLFVTDMYRNLAYENPHMFEIVTGATRSLEKKGYTLVLKSMTAAEAPAGIQEAMEREQADGVLIHAAVLTRQLAAVLMKAFLPYLVIGKPHFPTGICWMDANHELAGHLAGAYLLDKGYRRVVFLTGTEEEDKISESRLRGIRAAFDEEELRMETLPGEATYEQGILRTEGLIERAQPPEVILCTNNYLAVGCLQALRAKGFSVPGQIALMTFDNYPFSMIVEPPITAVEVDMFDMGWEAARFLMQRIRKPNLQTQSYCTAPVLIERSST